MAYDYLSLVNNVCEQLNEVNLTQVNFAAATGAHAQIKQAVNASIRDINQDAFEWPFNHTTQELVLTADQVRYAFPATAKSINFSSFRIKQSDALGVKTIRLRQIDYEEYLDKYVEAEYDAGASSNVPRYVFMGPDSRFGIYPAPDKAYTLVYEFYNIPDDLSLNTDVPSLPYTFRQVIIDGAMHYAFMFRGDPESSAVMLQKRQVGIKQLRSVFQNRFEYVRSGYNPNASVYD